MSSARSPSIAARVIDAFDRFLHVEAISGILLLLAAAAALVWANSPFGASYDGVWHAPLTVAIGSWSVEQPLHFWINDGLMTVFFLVVGLEIRRELHVGTLATLRRASLPLAAAVGGVVVPALVYVAVASGPAARHGWAVPTATDIAFAVGVLALLGKSVPAALRVLLLSLAVIDDMAAIVVIAVFYSAELAPSGLLIALAGVVVVLLFQRLGVKSALTYVLPGAVLWFGLLRFGVHPTLAGVILGLMTPTVALEHLEPLRSAARALRDLKRRVQTPHADLQRLGSPLRQLRHAQFDLLPPTVRVQMALHPWVAYGVMPLFALANAGVVLEGLSLSDAASRSVAVGVFLALVVGKPLGIVTTCWLAVRLGWCTLPPQIDWKLMALLGCLGGVGFTMAIFIASLAFSDEALLDAAKLAVLVASATAGLLGLTLGYLLRRPQQTRPAPAPRADAAVER